MSQENVEIVRTLAEWFQHRQHEQAFELYDPEIEWDASRMAERQPDNAGIYHGHEGVRAFWRDWLSAWSDLQFEIEDVVDGGEEIVLLVSEPAAMGTTQRHRDRDTALRDGVHRSRREGRSSACLCRPGIRPRSRRAAGVAAPRPMRSGRLIEA